MGDPCFAPTSPGAFRHYAEGPFLPSPWGGLARMINYTEDWVFAIIFRLRGSVALRATCFALPAALACLGQGGASRARCSMKGPVGARAGGCQDVQGKAGANPTLHQNLFGKSSKSLLKSHMHHLPHPKFEDHLILGPSKDLLKCI